MALPELTSSYLDASLSLARDLSRLFPSSPSPYLEATERNRLAWTFVDEALERRGRDGESTAILS